MSLRINTDHVAAVLLADGWHKVKGTTFNLDAYEYVDSDGKHPLLRGGAEKTAGIPATGATWQEPNGDEIACPLTAVLAVKLQKKGSAPEEVSTPRAGGRRLSAGMPGGPPERPR